MRLSFCNSIVHYKRNYPWYLTTKDVPRRPKYKKIINYSSINKEMFCTLIAIWLGDDILLKLRFIKS